MSRVPAAILRSVCVAIVALALSNLADAQTYPSKPVKVINPWPTGGSADALIRLVAERMSIALGQPVIVESQAGANGMIGHAAVAKAQPDGYTLLFSHVGPMTINPHLQANMPYDSIRDFEPITQLTSSPLAMLVRPDLPIRTVRDLLDYAKANPGKLNMGSIGSGSTPHLAAELMRSITGMNYVHVPYKGAAPVITDLLGGQIDFTFLNLGGVQQYVDAGRIRAIGMTSLKRSASAPTLPTVSETLPDFEVNSWYGMAAPAGTPKSIVNRLNAELVKILRAPEMTARLVQLSYDVEGTTPEQHAARIREDLAKWAAVIKATGLTRQ
ncbi:MAG: tripartite tricarboxylate transporter substrate binding protein [Betaproteobacteria bacterium]|nr:tripartite tricarboxylate transporter substrate binding protein [Betaproteobacteria bacterium]